MIRYGFNIRTRSGLPVENISIMAPSLADAERRLRQMYDRCQIVACLAQSIARRVDGLDLETVIEIIGAAEPPPPVAAVSRHKPGTH
jgi:hypothetical protein